jgi:hypothetical protein
MAARTLPPETGRRSQLLGVPAAAAYCRVKPAEILRGLTNGLYPGAKKGDDGHWLIPLADLEAAMAGVFGAHRTTAELAAFEVSVRSAPEQPSRRRMFAPNGNESNLQVELQRKARKRSRKD